MTRQRYLILFIVGFGVVCLAAVFQGSPGYMDADYYLLGGMQLAEGKGFTEPILWNYLDDPDGLPHPSHGYWMPLTSILAAVSLWLTPFNGFTGARIIFLILAGCVPPVTAWLAWELLSDRTDRVRRNMAMFSGLLAAFPGFYLPFLTVPDAFAVYMLCGTVILGVVGSDREWGDRGRGDWGKWLGVGVFSGLMHLARADGFLWLGVVIIGVILKNGLRIRDSLSGIGYSVGGYLLVMGLWMVRNLRVFGTPLSPGGSKALWALNYDELFSFPVSGLTFERWWASGLGAIVQARIDALGQNLQTTLGVQGAVFLLPLILAGLWQLRKKRAVQAGVLAWGLTLVVMTFVFPFSGARGGFFHSGASVQPLFWAAVPVGLEAFVEWGGRSRGWRVAQAQRVFGIGLVGMAIFLTVFIFVTRVLAEGEIVGYAEVEEKMGTLEVEPDQVVMVNNPPGFFLASGRPAVVIPNGGLETWLSVAEKYEVDIVIVDENVPVEVRLLLESMEQPSRFMFMDSVGDFRIYRVMNEGLR